MISIKISNEIVDKHRNYLRSNPTMLQKLEELKEKPPAVICKRSIESEHKAFIDWIIKEYRLLEIDTLYKKSIFLQKPELMKKTIKELEKNHNTIFKLCKEEINKEEEDGEENYSKYINTALGYDEFARKRMADFRYRTSSNKKYIGIDNYSFTSTEYRSKWSAYAFVMELGLKVCPYCNRTFITPLYSPQKKCRGDLDHFLPKSKYPYFSISIFNLIPCCKVCNSSFKGSKDFDYDEFINLYEDKCIEDKYRFTYSSNNYESLVGISDDEMELKILYDEADTDYSRIRSNIEEFGIEEIYQYHKDIVKKLIQKKEIYSKEYIEQILVQYNTLFHNENEIFDLLFDTTNNENIKNNILGKLKNDIIKELFHETVENLI